MIRFYSLFITDDNLLSGAYVNRLNLFHDLSIKSRHKQTVNFLLQTPLTEEQAKELRIIYDPLLARVLDSEAKSFRHQTLVTLTLFPVEIGSTKIGIAFPHSIEIHKEQIRKLSSPLVSIPCNKVEIVKGITQKSEEEQHVTI